MPEQAITILFAVVGASVVVLLTTIVIMCYKWFGQYTPPASRQARSSIIANKQSGLVAQSTRVRTVRFPVEFPAEFHDFMQGVIQIFQAQRKEATSEFAVLFLWSDRDLRDISTNMHFPTEPTDCNSPTFPCDEDLVNYVTARPHGDEHADTILLGKLDTLLENFGEDQCQTIVLYTWLLPCSSHKDQTGGNSKVTIIDKLGRLAKNKQVILVYTEKLSSEELGGVTDEEEARIVLEIQVAGISVLKEPYHHHLPPLINWEQELP